MIFMDAERARRLGLIPAQSRVAGPQRRRESLALVKDRATDQPQPYSRWQRHFESIWAGAEPTDALSVRLDRELRRLAG